MLADVPVIDYLSADPETQRKLQALMWLSQLSRYDSTTPYIRGRRVSDEPYRAA